MSEPTRDRLLRYLVEAGVPVTIATLTAAFGLNHTTVREHVAKLRAAGLVSEEREAPANRRGRPRLLYRATADAYRLAAGNAPYEQLTRLLLDALTSGDDPLDVGRRAAAEPAATGDPVAALSAALGRQGFAPAASRDGGEIVLGHCPYADAATRAPAIVCRLHLGLVQGMAGAIGGVEVAGLETRDPYRAGCRLGLQTAPQRAG